MPRLFAVTRSRGPAWNAERPMEEQDEWHSHAVFMTALHRDGFVLLVGPLEGTPDVLLIALANDVDEIRSRLSGGGRLENAASVWMIVNVLWEMKPGSPFTPW